MKKKKCSKCDRTLPAEAFYSQPNTRTGLSYVCKECARKTNREIWARQKAAKTEAVEASENHEPPSRSGDDVINAITAEILG